MELLVEPKEELRSAVPVPFLETSHGMGFGPAAGEGVVASVVVVDIASHTA